jgi:hypothetical protein
VAKVVLFVDEANLYGHVKPYFLVREAEALAETGHQIKCVVDPVALGRLAIAQCVRARLLPAEVSDNPDLQIVMCCGIPQIQTWPSYTTYGPVKRIWQEQSNPEEGIEVQVRDRPNHIIWENKRPVGEKQDGIDVLVGVELVYEALAAPERCDVLMLLTGDTDLGHAAEKVNTIRVDQFPEAPMTPFITVGWEKPVKKRPKLPFCRLSDMHLTEARLELDPTALSTTRVGPRQR